jgi:aminoglycoside N3'-acetyltransferase
MAAHAVESLARDLRALGLGEGDLVMVHASLRKIGPVDGGADGVLDAIESVIGAGGTIFMTLGAQDDWGWVNERPEDERARLLADAVPFDARTTPADPDIGVLAEVFRTRPRTVVSDHPEGRFGASGSLATHLTEDVPWHHYYGPGSPLERFVAAGGKVLRLGADLDTVTALHHAEYLTDVPHKRHVRRHRLVLDGGGGTVIRAVECLDDSDGIVDRREIDGSDEDYFASILTAYLETGRARTGMVGGAPSELVNGADIVAFGAAWMRVHLVAGESGVAG